MARLGRALGICALICALVVGGPGSAAAQWAANEDDALLFDARLGQLRLGDGVRGYQTPDGVCVIFNDVIKTLDIPVEIDKGGQYAWGWAFEERNQLKIDRAGGKVRVADKITPLSANTVRDTKEGWCVDVGALSAWTGVDFRPDMGNALLFLSAKNKLPVELAAERRARAARIRPEQKVELAKLPQAKLPYELWRLPSLDAVVTVGGIADDKRGDRFDARWDLFASGEVAGMSVDARLGSNNRAEPSDLRIRAYRSDANAELLGPLKATHVAVGDVASYASPLAANSVSGRGAVVTNRPIGRQDTFDRKTFRGELPTGWDAEIYRNGQLLDVQQTRADGRYEFVDVPLLYGQNRFEIILYGPQGQVRRYPENALVGAESIPPRETWYWASVTEDERAVIPLSREFAARGRGWRATAGIERGIDTKTSLSAQVHTLMLEDERLTFVEGSVRRSVGPALVELTGSYEAKGGVAMRAHALAQFGDTFVTAESIVARKYTSDRVERGLTSSHLIALDHAFDLGKIALPVHAEGRYIRHEDGRKRIEAGVRVSTTIDRVSVTGAIDWRRWRGGIGPPAPDTVDASLFANGSIGKTRIRGETRWRLAPESRLESATLIAQRQIGLRSDIRAEIGYEHGLDRGRLGLGYVRRFDKFALSVTGEAATDGAVAAGLNLAFSIGPDPRRGGGMRVTANKLASAGSMLARVYHDENGDGMKQYSEAYAPDVQIMIGRTPTEQRTDRNGETLLDGMEPHRPLLIGIDASSLNDPLTQPRGPGIVVTPRPGLATIVDLPLVSAGEVIGTLHGPNGTTMEGVDLELVDARGNVVAVTRSDFDGYFQFESVAYGDYRLRINRLSANAAGLGQALDVRASINGKAPSVRLGRVMAAAAAPGITIAARTDVGAKVVSGD